jgi:hypothetical protein
LKLNSYQMVLHRPVETARVIGKFGFKLPNPVCGLRFHGRPLRLGSASIRSGNNFPQMIVELEINCGRFNFLHHSPCWLK